MSQFDQVIFGKKTFSDLLKDIYDNSRKTEKNISELIVTLQPLIKNSGDATILVPLIKEYLEVKVKNDEHLVKMAAIVQRAVSVSESTGADLLISETEKEQLYNLGKELQASIKPVQIPEKINENKGKLIADISNSK